MGEVKILADTINPSGSRLTTFEATVPKYVLAQLAKHRQLSMNFESSRAKPFWKVLKQVCQDPYVPTRFGKPSKGMQPAGYAEGEEHERSVHDWLAARDVAVESAVHLAADASLLDIFAKVLCNFDEDFVKSLELRVAKETVNRLLEPFMKVSGIISATEWDNFLKLRTAPDAQDDINILARGIQELLESHEPALDTIHAPYGDTVEAVERIARVSYGNHNAVSQREPGELYAQLVEGGHWSPFEHFAYADDRRVSSNFDSSWHQLRHIEESSR